MNTQILPIGTLHGLFLTVEFPSAVKEGGAGAALDGEGEHHADGDEAVGGLFAAGDEGRVEVGGDVFVEDFAFSHGCADGAVKVWFRCSWAVSLAF